MKARNITALLLAVLLLVALFAGCGGNTGGSTNTGSGNSGSSNTGSANTGSGSSDAGSTDAGSSDVGGEAAEDEGPYHFAKDYAVNEEGFPLEKYVYTQPLCDTDEVLTRWTTCYTPQYLPEDGFNGIRTWQEVEGFTGVHIEYDVVSSDTRNQNFAVLLASDDLHDILDQGWYMYTGTYDEALEEGYFADLYPYKHLMPNYMYETWSRSQTNADVMPMVFYNKEHIVTLWGMVIDPVPSMGYVLRQDWLNEMGMGRAQDVKTFDQLHDVLVAMKVNYSIDEEIFPYFIYSAGESTPGYAYCGYNTALWMDAMSYVRVVDGEVQFCGATDDDRALMTMLNSWYNEGLISPNFGSYVIGGDFDAGTKTNKVGAMPELPAGIIVSEASSIDPDTQWEPIPRTRLYEGQILEYGNKLGETHYGSCNISASCENIELAVSLCDWWFSDFGADFTSWGPEGWMWNYNEQGVRQLEDWVINHEAGLTWIMIVYANNNLLEFCLHDIRRSYYVPGGERPLAMYDTWSIPDYGGSYDWPSSINFTADQTAEANSLMQDLNTFYAETYVTFLNGDKPLSEWDSYIEDLNQFGYARVVEIYQEAYDAYMAENA